jgi:predicted phage terminase large subunit-like protein
MATMFQLTRRELAALRARRDFPAFCRVVYRPYQHAPHIALIAAALADVARYIETQGRKGVGRLRIELPPRHGKSQLVARLFPAWIMGRNPDLRLILASHGAQLSESHSRYIRNTIRTSAYASTFPNVRLAADSAAREAWDIADPHMGGLLAVGTGGSVTGRGAGLIVCDDLVKSREEVESEAARNKLWDWYTSDLLTRQEPGAAIVHIGTRWHTDDILGRLDMQDTDEQWTVIRLPALAEDGDPLGRAPGSALWPDRFGVRALEAQRESMGDYAFSALYQQAPVPSSGGVFTRDKFHIVDAPTVKITDRVRFWDLAISTKAGADYTVGTLIGQTEDRRYVVLDVQRFRLGWQAVMDRIAQTAREDGVEVRIGIEQVLFSAAAPQQLLQRPDMHSHSITGVEVHKDKLTRALPFAARVDAGMVDVLRRAWTQQFLDEVCSFPNGRHDDQVDSAASAYEMLSRNGIMIPIALEWNYGD